MKKIKQFADKAFVRTDRTDVLSEELVEAERRIELLRGTCEALMKRLISCISGKEAKGEPMAIEKRIRKVPEFMLGSNMVEFGSRLGSASILGELLEETGKIEMKLGSELVEYQDRIEKLILQPIAAIVQTEIPNVLKSKRHLLKLVEAMDIARAKVNRHSVVEGRESGDELDDLVGRVEQARDTLAAEMFTLLARESEVATLVVQFLQYQREYHTNVGLILSSLCPEVEVLLNEKEKGHVFGVELSEHLAKTGRNIAAPLELCVCALLESLDEEGLLRMAGGSARIRKLKSAFDAHLITLPGLLADYDAHVIANTLKSYFRSLPTPLLVSTSTPFVSWADAVDKEKAPDKKLERLKSLIGLLPRANSDNLRYLIRFLARIEARADVNKMTSSNIAIVVGPNLIWGEDVAGVMASSSMGAGIVDLLIKGYTEVWGAEGGDLSAFYVTCERAVVPPESPKPVLRRKNKAPTVPPPPSVTSIANRDGWLQQADLAATTTHHVEPNNGNNQLTGAEHVNSMTSHLDSEHAQPQVALAATKETGTPQSDQYPIPTQQESNKAVIKEMLADWCREKQAPNLTRGDISSQTSATEPPLTIQQNLLNQDQATPLQSGDKQITCQKSFDQESASQEIRDSSTSSQPARDNQALSRDGGSFHQPAPSADSPAFYSLPRRTKPSEARPVPAPRSSLQKPQLAAKPQGVVLHQRQSSGSNHEQLSSGNQQSVASSTNPRPANMENAGSVVLNPYEKFLVANQQTGNSTTVNHTQQTGTQLINQHARNLSGNQSVGGSSRPPRPPHPPPKFGESTDL